MKIEIELATEEDDAALRHLLAANPVPGRVTIAYEREPAYFPGCGVMGRQCQTLLARHEGEVIGAACRAIRPVFINGEIVDLGYLGQLRVDARFRGRWLVSRGFRALRELHEAQPAPAYLLSVIEENREALGVLVERRRRHFPSFHEVGRLHTMALPLGAPGSDGGGYPVAGGTPSDLPGIVRFLHRHGARRQFFPAYGEEDFLDGVRTRGFRIEDFLVARRDGEIAGILGVWDQSAYKQTVVRGYAGRLGVIRPFYNIAAKWRGRPRLPAIGEEIRSAYAAFVCVDGDDRRIFQALLRRACRLAGQRGFSYLMIGLEDRDPLLGVVRHCPHINYPSRLFLAGWDDGATFYERLDKRIPYAEIAAL